MENAADKNCKFPAGIMIPVIDPGRCEAKGPCVTACPYNVLAIRIVPAENKAALAFFDRIKLFAHGGKQAYAINPEACHGCGICVQVCPEEAIKLRKQNS
jgi:NAD-dependent dihydropyrimidine dehydrogenase PreA subunit